MKSFRFRLGIMLPVFMVWLALVAGFSLAQTGERTLTNQDVVGMVEAGLSDELIVAVIVKSPGEFTTDVDAILALKEKNVSEKVLQAMLQKQEPNKLRLLRKSNSPAVNGTPRRTDSFRLKSVSTIWMRPRRSSYPSRTLLRSSLESPSGSVRSAVLSNAEGTLYNCQEIRYDKMDFQVRIYNWFDQA